MKILSESKWPYHEHSMDYYSIKESTSRLYYEKYDSSLTSTFETLKKFINIQSFDFTS